MIFLSQAAHDPAVWAAERSALSLCAESPPKVVEETKVILTSS